MVKRGSTYYPSADEQGWKVVYFFLHYSMICIGASQSCLSWSFQTNNTIFTPNQCEKMPIQYPVLGFESTISLHKSSSITIRPGLLYYYSCSDLAKFRNFGKILKALGNFTRVQFVLGKILNLLWQQFLTLLGKFCKWPKIALVIWSLCLCWALAILGILNEAFLLQKLHQDGRTSAAARPSRKLLLRPLLLGLHEPRR